MSQETNSAVEEQPVTETETVTASVAPEQPAAPQIVTPTQLLEEFNRIGGFISEGFTHAINAAPAIRNAELGAELDGLHQHLVNLNIASKSMNLILHELQRMVNVTVGEIEYKKKVEADKPLVSLETKLPPALNPNAGPTEEQILNRYAKKPLVQ